MPSDLTGRQFLQFKIEEELGAGGMGVVYAAVDTRLDCRRALKFLSRDKTESEPDRKRLMREAQAVAGLDHPNICAVHDVCEADGQLFIVMSLLEGESLDTRISAGRLAPAEALDIALQVAAGLRAAQEQDLVHNDVKPGNLMITPAGQVKIMDFGIVRSPAHVDDAWEEAASGTTSYMSPEQTRGEDLDGRSDIWALGVVLYEMLIGIPPFRGDHAPAVQYSIRHEQYRAPGELRGDLPPDLERIMKRCLEKDPSLRYQTAADMEADLRQLQGLLDEQVHWDAERGPARPSKGVHPGKAPRFRVSIGVAPALIVLLLALLLIVPDSCRLRFTRLPDEKHLAVLPITAFSGSEEDRNLCNGLVEFLTSRLTQLEKVRGALRVIPASVIWRNGVMALEEARDIGATLVVDGSLQRDGTRIRLILNLIDTRRERIIRAAVIDYEMLDSFSLQERALIRLTEMLALELEAQWAPVPAAFANGLGEAQLLYLKGRGALQNLRPLRPLERVARIDAALGTLERAQKLNPASAPVLAALGEACWRKYEAVKEPGLAERARAYCDLALELEQEDARIHYTCGLVQAGTGHYEAAIASQGNSIRLDSLAVESYRELSAAYRMTSRPELAEGQLQVAVDLRPDDWLSHYELGCLRYRIASYDASVESFERVIELTPNNYVGYAMLGGVCQMIWGREAEGAAHLRRSIEIKPNSVAFNNLGYHHARAGDVAEAATAFGMSTELNPNDYRVWGNLGSQYDLLPDREENAGASYRRAADLAEEELSVNARNTSVFGPLASYYVQLGEKLKAVALVERLLILAPDNVNMVYLAGHTFEQLGLRERALDCLGRAIEMGYPPEAIEKAVWLADLVSDKRYQALRERD